MKKKLIMLVDYRNGFYSIVRYQDSSIDVAEIASHFGDMGYVLEVLHYRDVDEQGAGLLQRVGSVSDLRGSASFLQELYRGYPAGDGDSGG